MPSILTAINDSRANTYRMLAGLFLKEPDIDILNTLQTDLDMTFKDSPEDIAADFNNIFAGQEDPLVPNESLYHYPLADKPRLWGKATEEVQKFYKGAGVMLYEEMGLLPDHISVELLFMSYLAENGKLELQTHFLSEHIMQWVPQYCTDIADLALTTFYKEIAEITKNFILSDYEELQAEII